MKNIYKALADFQQEVPIIYKETQAYSYKYADLPAIFTIINPLLKKHGLGFTQLLKNTELETIVFHCESGEELKSIVNIPQDVELKGQNDFQVMGSAITYLRRYTLSAMLGLITDKDTDAQGEQKKKPVPVPAPAPQTPTAPTPPAPQPMTDKQFEAIKNLLNSDKKEEQEKGVKNYELFLKPPYTMTEAQRTELSQIYNFLKA
jgi:hypothetical protein